MSSSIPRATFAISATHFTGSSLDDVLIATDDRIKNLSFDFTLNQLALKWLPFLAQTESLSTGTVSSIFLS